MKKLTTGDDNPMNREILTIVKSYCGSKALTRFLADRKKLHVTEKRVLGNNGRHYNAGNRDEGIIEDKTSFDSLLTMCKHQLPDREYAEVLLGIGNILKTHSD